MPNYCAILEMTSSGLDVSLIGSQEETAVVVIGTKLFLKQKGCGKA